MAKENKGRFQKGHDLRRHKFTRDECVTGFWKAIESIVIRHPEAIDKSGRHIACRFLKRKSRG